MKKNLKNVLNLLCSMNLIAGSFFLATSCSQDEQLDNETLTTTTSSALSSSSVKLPIVNVSASTQQSANPASNVIDGNISNRWSGYGTSASLYLDLGAQQDIDYLKIDFYKGNERQAYFTYWYSNDGTSWNYAGKKTSSGTTDSFETFDLSNNSSRYLRIKCEGTSSGQWNSINEIEVYGTASSGSTNNLALNGTANQSSTAYSGAASRAIDGNTSGVWNQSSVTHTSNSYRPWWQVYLDNNYTIGDIVVWNRTDCCSNRLSNFDVFVYNSSGSQVFKTTITDTPNPSITISTGGVVGNRVRIKLRDTNPLSLAEVQVFENSSSSSTPSDSSPTGTTSTGSTSSHPTGSDPWDFFHNCDQWKITWIDGSEQKQLCTQDEVIGQYEVDGDALVFTVDLYGDLGTTSGATKYSRSELREREEDGGSDIYWTTTGDHAMYIDEAITQKPNGKDHVVAGQIHGNKDDGIDDSMVVRLEGDHLFISFNGGNLREDVTIKRGYNLGDRFEVIFRIINGRHYCYYSEDGNLKTAYNNGNANGYLISDGGSTTLLNLNYDETYFKVGNYCQSNEAEESDRGTWGSSDNKCEVRVYGFDVNHEGGDFR